MARLSNFGLLEILILAGGAGLMLLIGAMVVAVVLNKRRKGRVQVNDSSANGDDTTEWGAAPKREPEARKRESA